jgi:hypothetical protein
VRTAAAAAIGARGSERRPIRGPREGRRTAALPRLSVPGVDRE